MSQRGRHPRSGRAVFALRDPCLSGSFNERELRARGRRLPPAPCQNPQPRDSGQGKEVAQMLPPLSGSLGPGKKLPQPNAAGETLAWSEFQKLSPTDGPFSAQLAFLSRRRQARGQDFLPNPRRFPLVCPRRTRKLFSKRWTHHRGRRTS